GPLLAMLLKYKGFEPVVYERHPSVPSGGLSMNLSPQVFKVLHILGLAEEAIALGIQTQRMVHRSEITGKILQDIEVGERIRNMTGWPTCIIVRAKFCRFLVQKAEERGVPFHWSKKLVDVNQTADNVTAVFADVTTDEGDLLVGCDGLHSKVRDALFGETSAEYTGLVAIGGFAPYTKDLQPRRPYSLDAVWGRDCFFLLIPTADDKFFWAINMPRDGEMKEDWRTADVESLGDMLDMLPPVHWSGDSGKIIKSSEGVIRFGLYLRPIPPVWHKGRAVLLGDAAHPTTPFLGQGANQSAEDIYHLVRMLVRHEPLTNESLEEALREYTTIRRTRVVRTIEQTKKEGAGRIAKTKEDLMAREAEQAKGLESATWKVILEMVQGPFAGESEI
ncbi:FAD/NADP-binding domain-containing protein, partial [Dacryopinax primogenitus]